MMNILGNEQQTQNIENNKDTIYDINKISSSPPRNILNDILPENIIQNLKN